MNKWATYLDQLRQDGPASKPAPTRRARSPRPTESA
jgi:hypothetical protein